METTVIKKTWTEKELMALPDDGCNLHAKIVEYFENDTQLVWVINPDEQTVLVHHSPRPDKLLAGNSHLTGEGVLKGFTLPVSELFAEL